MERIYHVAVLQKSTYIKRKKVKHLVKLFIIGQTSNQSEADSFLDNPETHDILEQNNPLIIGDGDSPEQAMDFLKAGIYQVESKSRSIRRIIVLA